MAAKIENATAKQVNVYHVIISLFPFQQVRKQCKKLFPRLFEYQSCIGIETSEKLANNMKRGKEKMSTIKDLKRWYDCAAHCKTGYCCEQDIQGKSKYDLEKLGYNAGVYGWNWTAYLDSDTNTLYVSYYRNVPSYIREK